MEFLNSINKIINNYELFLIDQWGVLHDGNKAYDKAIEALSFLKNNNKKMIIISNSSQREAYTRNNVLKKIGINCDLFSKIVTSGEIVWNYLCNKYLIYNKPYPKCYHITHLKDDVFLSNLNINISNNIDDTNFILNSSITPGLDINDFTSLLKKAKKLNIPMICSNPDEIVFDGNLKKIVSQSGILAKYYEKIGGYVTYFGKPYKTIFEECISNYKYLSKKRIICIGDSLQNDIKGANNFNIDSILIKNGVHKKELSNINSINTEKLTKILKKHNAYPNYILNNFEV